MTLCKHRLGRGRVRRYLASGISCECISLHPARPLLPGSRYHHLLASQQQLKNGVGFCLQTTQIIIVKPKCQFIREEKKLLSFMLPLFPDKNKSVAAPERWINIHKTQNCQMLSCCQCHVYCLGEDFQACLLPFSNT